MWEREGVHPFDIHSTISHILPHFSQSVWWPSMLKALLTVSFRELNYLINPMCLWMFFTGHLHKYRPSNITHYITYRKHLVDSQCNLYDLEHVICLSASYDCSAFWNYIRSCTCLSYFWLFIQIKFLVLYMHNLVLWNRRNSFSFIYTFKHIHIEISLFWQV